jgi:hypothetical protein
MALHCTAVGIAEESPLLAPTLTLCTRVARRLVTHDKKPWMAQKYKTSRLKNQDAQAFKGGLEVFLLPEKYCRK